MKTATWGAVALAVGYAIVYSTTLLGRPLHGDVLRYVGILDGTQPVWLSTGIFLPPSADLVESAALALAFIPTRLFGEAGLLGVAAVLVGASAVPLFWVASERVGNVAGLFVAVAYLAYFPVWGIIDTDFGTELFFPFFFLTGYALLVRGMPKASAAVLVCSAFVHYGFGDLVALYGFMVAVGREPAVPKRLRLPFSTVLIVAGFAPIAWNLILLAATGGRESLLLLAGSSNPYMVAPSPADFLFTVLIAFGPLLFISFFSPRWMVMAVPFFILASQSNDYTGSALLASVHPTAYIAFAFLGMVEGLALLRRAVSVPPAVVGAFVAGGLVLSIPVSFLSSRVYIWQDVPSALGIPANWFYPTTTLSAGVAVVLLLSVVFASALAYLFLLRRSRQKAAT